MEMYYEVDCEKPVSMSSLLLNHNTQKVKKEFRFKWTVENVSMCTQKRWEAVESPKFAVEDNAEAKWLLKLYPGGRSDENHMACYLEREIGRQQTSDYTNFTLSYLEKDGNLKEVEIFLDEDFPEFENTHYGTDYFKPIEDGHNKLLDCEEDILIIYCHIWWYQKTKSPIIECSAHTLIKIERFSFAWDLFGVKRTSSHRVPPVMESKLKIPMISTNLASSFELELQFEHNRVYERIGCIYLVATGTKEKPISSRLKITTKYNMRSEYGNFIFQPSTSEQKWFFSNVPGKKEINRGWFSGDYKLNLICELIISAGEELKQIDEIRYGLPFVEICKKENRQLKTNFQTSLGSKYLQNPIIFDENVFVQTPTSPERARSDTDISDQTHLKKTTSNKSTETDNVVSITNSKSPLKDDLFLLYSDKILCDAYLLANDEKLYAHKVVLAARSPVLSDIIKENGKDSVVEIEDISNSNPSTLCSFIKYLYTDQIEDLRTGSALQMYFCANKYKVLDLQDKCFQFLKTSSFLADICDIFSEDGIRDEGVKDLAVKFFADNASEIFSSKEWEEVTKEKSHVALKLMTLVCMNLSQNLS